MANSFHLDTGTSSRNYRQGNAFQINSFFFFHLCWGVSEYRVILPTFVLFTDDVQVYKLVRFYVNSKKKPNTSMSFIVAFSNLFHDTDFVVFIFGMERCDYTF